MWLASPWIDPLRDDELFPGYKQSKSYMFLKVGPITATFLKVVNNIDLKAAFLGAKSPLEIAMEINWVIKGSKTCKNSKKLIATTRNN